MNGIPVELFVIRIKQHAANGWNIMQGQDDAGYFYECKHAGGDTVTYRGTDFVEAFRAIDDGLTIRSERMRQEEEENE